MKQESEENMGKCCRCGKKAKEVEWLRPYCYKCRKELKEINGGYRKEGWWS